MDFNYTIEINQHTSIIIQVVDFMPGRPAPPCSNPSSPLYSDCGDDAEFETADGFLICGGVKQKLSDEIMEQLVESVFDEIIEEGERICWEDEGDDRYIEPDDFIPARY